MSILKAAASGPGYLKAGFLGFPKSGKTWTAIDLAIGIRKFFKLDGPIVMYDTETGADYVAQVVKKATGLDLLVVQSRTLADMMTAAQEALAMHASVFLADSVTHPWRELCESYLAQINAARREKGWTPRKKLEFQDWGPIKAKWAEWSDFYLTKPMHMIVCGRAGYEYDMETNEETDRKELVKTGVRMKTEGEFGFEPSLLVMMERDQEFVGGSPRIIRRAVVMGDRFDQIDGQTFPNPTFKDFLPHVKRLIPGATSGLDTTGQTDMGVTGEGEDSWSRERRERQIFSEEIIGELQARWPGQTTAEKSARQELLFKVFGTRSWTKVEHLTAARLKEGLMQIRRELHPEPAAAESREGLSPEELAALDAKDAAEAKAEESAA